MGIFGVGNTGAAVTKLVAPTIVVTGGKQAGDRFTEAGAGYRYLREQGVPEELATVDTALAPSLNVDLAEMERRPSGLYVLERR